MSLAISRPTDSVTWLKLLALPFLLFTPSQTLSTRQVMDLLAVDDWQSFFLGQPRHINPPSLAPSITNNATLQFRCAKLVESGNLGKIFQLISSPSSVSTLTPRDHSAFESSASLSVIRSHLHMKKLLLSQNFLLHILIYLISLPTLSFLIFGMLLMVSLPDMINFASNT